MEITDVKIYPVGEDKLQAFVSIVFDHCFRITDIKIIDGGSGRFLSMPSKRRKDGTYRDIAHPLNSKTRKRIETLIFERYDAMMGEAEAAGSENGDHEAETSSAHSPEEPHTGLAAESSTPSEAPGQMMV